MVLPRPPWARTLDRCPRCLEKIADDRAFVCDHCGYHLRMPRVSLAGLVLLAASLGAFFASAFGGFLFPWPQLPFPIPFLGTPTGEDLATLSLWLGVILLFVGIAATAAGAYVVRRKGERVGARRAA